MIVGKTRLKEIKSVLNSIVKNTPPPTTARQADTLRRVKNLIKKLELYE